MRSACAALVAAAMLCSCTPAEPPAAGEHRIERLVTLAPNLTELVFAAGAGDLLVAVSSWSDYPPAAAVLPIVSDAFTVDQEALTLLRPDAVLAWQSGTPAHVVDELRAAGFRVVVVRTRGLADVATALQEIGRLTGRRETADRAAQEFRATIDRLRDAYAGKAAISVFYQVSARPLYTINGDHFIGEIIALCGGRNIFADLDNLAPSVDVEAVIDRDPEVLLAASDSGELPFADWQRWPGLTANRYGNHFAVSAAEIGRATPRLANAAVEVCNALESARQNRAAAND